MGQEEEIGENRLYDLSKSPIAHERGLNFWKIKKKIKFLSFTVQCLWSFEVVGFALFWEPRCCCQDRFRIIKKSWENSILWSLNLNIAPKMMIFLGNTVVVIIRLVLVLWFKSLSQNCTQIGKFHEDFWRNKPQNLGIFS